LTVSRPASPIDLWVRVDDRLIHGQVTVGWRQHLRYTEIWVVDDLVRADPFLPDVLRLSAPDGVSVRVYGVEEAAAAWSRAVREPAAGRKVLLLAKQPQSVLVLIEAGLPLSHLNVGNLAARPGSRRAFKAISLTPEHIAALDALAGRGVRITFQLAPEDAARDWSAVRQRL